jgi:hypothetical protein
LVRSLLQAKKDEVLVLWSGLGDREGEKQSHDANDDFHAFKIDEPFAKVEEIGLAGDGERENS